MYLLKNISLYNEGKPLLLKNPHNTSRVKELLELFPDAKFIFLHRDPYTTFTSMMHLFNTVVRTQFFQKISDAEIRELVIHIFRGTLRKYVNDRSLIPEGNLMEVAYSDLSDDPWERSGTSMQSWTSRVFAMPSPACAGTLRRWATIRRTYLRKYRRT
ncbi:MAG: sulfotransferase [Candidatus Marinimicrobia bacterium]|nr:sulfotransferase [Candidatus Neomarinimicrobiota bacterium]